MAGMPNDLQPAPPQGGYGVQTPEQLGRAAGFATANAAPPALPRPIVPNAQQLVTNAVMKPVANTVQAGVQQLAGMPDWLRQLAAAMLPQGATPQIAGLPPAPATAAIAPAARAPNAQTGFIPVANTP